MKRSDQKANLRASLGALLTHMKAGKHRTETDFGVFSCAVETFDDFAIAERNFETSSDSLHIPFSCHEPGVQMIFSLDGHSFFNNKSVPLTMTPRTHSLNLFKRYDCMNLMDEHARQHDVTFRLKKEFYHDLITQYLGNAEDRLPMMIANGTEFNTINQHIPADQAINGILRNIFDCPFEGKMRSLFMRDHVRALLTLQIFHFSSIVTGQPVRMDTGITSRDREAIYAVKDYIDAHFLDPSSLDTLCKRFGLNEFKLKRGFKTVFDTSPMRYVQQKRLAFALQLLRDTNKTVKEISDEVGYGHAANFTIAFSKLFGNTPQYYRN